MERGIWAMADERKMSWPGEREQSARTSELHNTTSIMFVNRLMGSGLFAMSCGGGEKASDARNVGPSSTGLEAPRLHTRREARVVADSVDDGVDSVGEGVGPLDVHVVAAREDALDAVGMTRCLCLGVRCLKSSRHEELGAGRS